ncbi:SRPBCC family protein [Tersicoccus sp. Bi-70]|uniref:SRPBCC family protein n=1 Tax=Tersicoccus sp. Bi-70 TaxID=1897634 RepID=UPI000978163D|nr:SRPBCC family protein [Tersicoccus sp. Bi-70]OMH34214.1 ATPase [Tersicoccus sp. Bi-70]
MTQAPPEERYVRSRTIDAPPAAVFAVLTDPSRHQETEPTDWVRDARDTERLTAVGQVFAMNMFHTGAGGDYVMHNTVIALEPDRTIAWRPGQEHDGAVRSGGWTWRYDLQPTGTGTGTGTEVTLTYDWSAVPEKLRQYVNVPPFEPEFLDRSLAALETAATTPR